MQEPKLQQPGSAVSRKKKIIRNTALIFFSIVLLLTFFSNTINNMLLPEVLYTKPSGGILAKNINAAGEAKALNIQKVYSYGDWRVADVKVKPGATVAKGDILVVIDMGESEIELKKLELNISNMEFELRKIKREPEDFDISLYEGYVQQALKKVENCNKNLECVKSLYNSGAETLRNVTQAEEELENCKRDYSEKVKLHSNKQKEKIASEADNLEYIAQKALEISQKKLELEAFKERIPVSGELKSDVNGRIAAVMVDAGSYCSSGQLMVEVAEEEKGFIIEWKLNTSKAELLDMGNDIDFTVKASVKNVYNTKIKTKQYIPEDNSYLFVSESLKADGRLLHGQKVEVEAVCRSKQYLCIVPASSIIELNGTDHIFVLKERNGVLGVENYVEGIKIIAEDSDGLNTAISVILEADEKVVEYSTKALSDGMQVKLR